MPDERFGIDLSNWRTLAPARRGALTRLLIQRVGAARSRDIRKALLAALGEAGEWLCVLARQRRPVLFPRRAASWPRPARRRKEL